MKAAVDFSSAILRRKPRGEKHLSNAFQTISHCCCVAFKMGYRAVVGSALSVRSTDGHPAVVGVRHTRSIR